MAKELWFSSWQGQHIFLLSSVQTGFRLTQHSVHWVPGPLSVDVTWMGIEGTIHFHGFEFKSEMSYTSTVTCFM
jgi:hypothetical protein